MSEQELRVGVVGAGLMGADHIERIATRITGARVSAIVEPDAGRAAAAAATAPGAATFSRVEDAIEAGALDAVVIATPGQFHEPVLVPALDARLAILCEKPLTQDAASSWRMVEAEMATGAKRIQIGFMRRFDAEYAQLRELIASGEAGELLMLRGLHRNASVPDSYTQANLITDSVVHEFDVLPWLAGSPVATVQVRHAKRNRNSPAHLREPILVLMELADGTLVDVEMNVSVQFGYQVATEAVFSDGIARIGQPSGLEHWRDGSVARSEHRSFHTRFRAAYDAQVQAWVDAAHRGEIAGPSAWDGYAVAASCEAGVRALNEAGPVAVELREKPAFYEEAQTAEEAQT